MKTPVVNNSTATNKTNGAFVNPNAITSNANGNSSNGQPLLNEGGKSGNDLKTEEIKVQQMPKTDLSEVKTDQSKLEIKNELAVQKPALNLDLTLKMVKDLNRLSGQRERLIGTIDTLKAFEVAQLDEAEETDLIGFSGCELTITDDKGREFTTKNAFIIHAVATNVKDLCVDKLAEVESKICISA